MEFLGVSLAAWMSILALTIVIIISCVNEELHVGLLSIAFAIIVGAIFMNMRASDVVKGFPLSLFMILVGVTFMFAMAQVNGTLGKSHVLCDPRLRRQHDAAAPDHLRADHLHHHDRPGQHRRCRSAGAHHHGHRGPGGHVGLLHDPHRRRGLQLGGLLALRPHGDHLPRPRREDGTPDPGSLREVLDQRDRLEGLLQLRRGPGHRRHPRLPDLRGLDVDDASQGQDGRHQPDRPEARALHQAAVVHRGAASSS